VGLPIASIAARLQAGEPLAAQDLDGLTGDHVAVKEAVFPFARFQNVDPILGPEMRSTGEVMGLDRSFGAAFLKSQIAAGVRLPASGVVFVSVKDGDKPGVAGLARDLIGLGFEVVATDGTAEVLESAGVPVRRVRKVAAGSPHIVDAMSEGQVQLVINTTEGAQSVLDSYSIRRTALVKDIPYYTTMAGARAAVQAMAAQRDGTLDVAPLQAYT